MTIIKGSTKRGQSILAMARRYEGRYLHDVYGTVSAAKMRAYEDCLRWYREDNGENFHICSHNSFQFTVAWEYMNPETGELMTRVETSSHSYVVDGSRAKDSI